MNSVEIPEVLIRRLEEAGLSTRRFLKLDGKAAIEKDWPTKLYTPEELVNWRYNYGVCAGSGLILIDADEDPLAEWLQLSLPSTFQVKSPKHKKPHYYLKVKDGSPENLVLYWGDDKGQRKVIGHLQAQNKYLVGPGSIHPEGGVYKILADQPIAEVSWSQLTHILKPFLKEAIERVEEAIKEERQKTSVNIDILQVVPLSGLREQGEEYYGAHPIHGSETGRNFWVNPRKNVWHCFRCSSGGGPLLWLAVEEGLIRCEEAGPGALRGDLFKQVLAKARERGLIKEIPSKPQLEGVAKYFDADGRFVPALLAEELMGEYHFATMIDSKEIFVYLDGYYQPIGEVVIKRECKRRLGDEYRQNRAGEVIDYIEASTYTQRREEPPNLLPLNNGVLDINTMELKPYSPEYMFFNKLPVDYDPHADCPEIRKFHKEITNDEHDIRVLEEFIGYCLYRAYQIHKALMLVGDGANGKSTWLAMVRTFLGAKNVSGRSLFELEDVRFARADLFGKYANIYADLPDRALQRTGMFKMLTGGDQLAAEKKFRDSFHFVNYAKLLFSANKVPETVDDTDAFFRRWIIINFPNVFTGENCDPRKLEKITTKQELSGLLNVALAALKRILANGGFSFSKSTEETREDYIRKSSPIASFIMDCLEIDSDAFIEKKELFNVFAAYCRWRSIPCVTQTTFFKNLPQHVAVTDVRPTVGNNRITAFKGIRYSEGVSRVSGVSRVFYILIEQMKNKEFKEPWIVEKVDNSVCSIKIGKTLDILDTPDRKPAESVGEKLSLVYGQVRELAKDGLVNKFEVADSLHGRLERSEVFQLLGALAKEGKLQPKGVEWFLVV